MLTLARASSLIKDGRKRIATISMVAGLAPLTILAAGLGGLLFLVTEELFVEAHEEPETLLGTGMFFGGFLLFLIIA